MPRINLTSSLQAEYEELYRTCEIKDSRFGEVDRLVAGIVADEPRYAAVAATRLRSVSVTHWIFGGYWKSKPLVAWCCWQR